jgi:hypothetical protein
MSNRPNYPTDDLGYVEISDRVSDLGWLGSLPRIRNDRRQALHGQPLPVEESWYGRFVIDGSDLNRQESLPANELGKEPSS